MVLTLNCTATPTRVGASRDELGYAEVAGIGGYPHRQTSNRHGQGATPMDLWPPLRGKAGYEIGARHQGGAKNVSTCTWSSRRSRAFRGLIDIGNAAPYRDYDFNIKIFSDDLMSAMVRQSYLRSALYCETDPLGVFMAERKEQERREEEMKADMEDDILPSEYYL